MANKVLNTRVLLRYDSYTNWEAHKTSIPLKGEMCICTAGTVNPNVDDVLLKVGDGTTTWELLPWVSAKAADVHEWAKKSWDEVKVDIEALIKAGAELAESIIDGNKVIAHEEKLGTTYTSENDVSSIKSGETKKIKIPQVTVNKYGHITSAVDEEIEISIPNPGDSDTVRAVKVNGVEKLGSDNKDAIDYINGTNTAVAWDSTNKTLKIDAVDTTYDLKAEGNKIILSDGSLSDEVLLDNTDSKINITTDTTNSKITFNHATVTVDKAKNTDEPIAEDTRTFTAIGSITVDGTGHVTSAKPTTFTLPADKTAVVSEGNQIKVSSVTNGAVTTYTVAHESITRSDSETAKPDALEHGGTFTVVSSVVDDNGHVTNVQTKEYTLPGAATGGAAATNDTTVVSGAVLENDVLTVTKKTIVGDDDVIDVTYANNEIKVSADLKDYTKTSNLGSVAVTSVKTTGDAEITMTPKDATKGSVEVTATHTKHAFEQEDLGTITISQNSLNGSVVIPTLTVNEYGHVTAIGNKTLDITLPNVTGAMHFLGTTSTKVTDGGSENPIIIGDSSKTPVAGDVVIYNDLEYVFNDSGKWEVLGDEGSYALKTVSIIGGEGLTGTGTLVNDVTISHAGPGAVANTYTEETDRTYVSGISTDKFGHIVSVEFGTETVTEKKGFAFIQGDDGTTASADISEDTLKLYGDTYITTAAAESDPDEIQIKHNELHDNVGSTGPAAGGTLAYSGTFVVPALSYDKAGHITGAEERTFTLPAAVEDTNTVTNIVEDTAKSGVAGGLYIKDNHNVADDTHTYTIQHSTYSTGRNTSTGSVTDKGTFEVIDSITTDNGHVTSVNTKTITVNETPAFAKITPANSTATSAISKNTTSVTANTTSDELTIAAGNKWVELAGDNTNDKITIAHAVGTAGQAGALAFDSTTGVLTVPGAKWDEAGHVVSDVSRTIDLSALKPTKDNDTTGKNIVGASTADKENAAVAGTSTNGVTVDGATQKIYSADGVHLNHVETLDGTSTVVSSHKISGDGFIAVKSDASGNITVGVEQTGTDTLILVCGGADL